jgi:hypothetical protein
VRAAVAAEALDALQLFLRDPILDSSLSEVQSNLREAVTIEQIFRLVDLGNIVDEIIVKPRERMASSTSEETARISDATNSLFSQEEKTLWYVSVPLFGCTLLGSVVYSLSLTHLSFII